MKGAGYASNPLWSDIVPIEQDDGPDPVCPIAYTSTFKETMDYFRAILHKDERSQRALDLTKHVIEINPANYTAWYFRRLCLEALGDSADWVGELQFCDDLALAQQKNYQVWRHRAACVARLGEAVRERDLAFCARMLQEDSKNYHVWSYRQTAVLHFHALQAEEAFSREMIDKDVRNNSAWNERFWVMSELGLLRDAAACKREVEFALERARKAPSNESPWLYIRGISQHHPDAVDIEHLQRLAAQWMLCVPVRALLVHLFERQNRFDDALALCKECATQVDPIHGKYWNYKAGVIEAKKK